jgi:hypothetical protein
MTSKNAAPSKPYKMIATTPVYHWSTDAHIGDRQVIEAEFATYAAALAAATKANSVDGHDELVFSVAVVVDGKFVRAPEDVAHERARSAQERAARLEAAGDMPF